ncbi:MAG TPA: hypothetical protein DCS93_13035 [Microscillaceae bacterium]|nr:hypothetical protein [Microscillaceae bacterium]
MTKFFSVALLFLSFTVVGQSKLKPHYKGYDIFALKESIYIVRSDIGLFLKTKSMNGKAKPTIFSLNEAFANGNGYIGYKSGDDWVRCVIQKNSYVTYKNLTNMKGKRRDIVSSLAKNGDHYFAKDPKDKGQSIYVIKDGQYHIFKRLSDAKPRKSGTLPSYLKKNVVAYWAKRKYIYILKNTKYGPIVYRTTALKNPKPSSIEIAPNKAVRDFLIGGLTAKNGGSTSVVWKSVSNAFPFCNRSKNKNSSVAAPKLTESITVGFNKEYTSSIEHNWSVSLTLGAEMEKKTKAGVAEVVTKAHIELTTQYGGASIKTDSKQWSTENTTTVQLDEGKKVKGGKCIGYWQGQISIDGKLVMTTGIHFTDNNRPPKGKPKFYQVK